MRRLLEHVPCPIESADRGEDLRENGAVADALRKRLLVLVDGGDATREQVNGLWRALGGGVDGGEGLVYVGARLGADAARGNHVLEFQQRPVVVALFREQLSERRPYADLEPVRDLFAEQGPQRLLRTAEVAAHAEPDLGISEPQLPFLRGRDRAPVFKVLGVDAELSGKVAQRPERGRAIASLDPRHVCIADSRARNGPLGKPPREPQPPDSLSDRLLCHAPDRRLSADASSIAILRSLDSRRRK